MLQRLLQSLIQPVLAADLGGLNTTAGKAGYPQTSYPQNGLILGTIVNKIVTVALSFAGVVFLGLAIYGGVLWMTSGGSAGQIQTAKDILTASVIGLIVVAAAYALTVFVGANFQL